jgi:hypothetical protein
MTLWSDASERSSATFVLVLAEQGSEQQPLSAVDERKRGGHAYTTHNQIDDG